jgi:hypothetical protein
MQKLSKADYCDPNNYPTIVAMVNVKPPVRRRDFVLNINKINPFLAVRCVKEFRGDFKKDLQASIKEQALSHIQNVTAPRIVTNAFFALYELKEYDEISRVFRLVQNLEQMTYYQPIIQGIFSSGKDSDFVFRFLNILFDRLPINKRLKKSPAHTLWLSALENLSDAISISEYHVDLERFYRFFASQSYYSPSLHLLPEKFEGKFKFKQILSEFEKSSRLKEIYLNLSKRDPARLWDYFNEIKTENILLNTIEYSRLIHYTSDFQTAIDLFEQMQQQHLPVDEITYSTLINKANYELLIYLRK